MGLTKASVGMTDQQVEPRVTLLELTGALGGNHDPHGFVQADAIAPDWAGRPSVSLADAAEAVRGYREGVEKHERALDAFAEFQRERAGRKSAVYAEAYSKTHADYLRANPHPITDWSGTHNPARDAVAAAREAAERACENFDARNPDSTFEGWLRTREGREYA